MKHTKNPHAMATNGNGSAQKEPLDASVVSLENVDLTLEEMIAIAAYFRAELRGFAPGDELADWFQAEAEYKSRFNRNMN